MSLLPVSKGDPFNIRAQDWNDIARVVNRLSGVSVGNSVNMRGGEQNIFVNISAHRDLELGEAVALDKMLLSIEEGKYPDVPAWLTKDAEQDKQVIIVQEPCEKDKIALGMILGVSLAKVKFTQKETTHASPKGEKGNLIGASSGIPVLWQGGDSGEQYALVLLSGSGSGTSIVYVKFHSAMPRVSEATGDWIYDVLVFADPGERTYLFEGKTRKLVIPSDFLSEKPLDVGGGHGTYAAQPFTFTDPDQVVEEGKSAKSETAFYLIDTSMFVR